MADDTSADIVHLHQPKRAMTGAERVRLHRQRKRAEKLATPANLPVPIPAPVQTAIPVTPLPAPIETLQPVTGSFQVTPARRRSVAPFMLGTAAVCLALVGASMNAWYSRSLGATDTAGWMFLAVGVAADLVALTLPSVAAGLWQSRQRATAAVGWLVWLAVFAFALMSAVGFGAVNISDISAARGERVTASVAAARDGLADAVTARDRECRGGTGKYCRQREDAVAAARTGLDLAMATVQATSDPQTEAARRLVTWVSRGAVQPSADDFANLRLMLLALMPQIGGVLLLCARRGT